MDNSPCLQCNMYVANKFRKFQNGCYKRQFCIPPNNENEYFVQNPFRQKKCKDMSDVVLYDVFYGASKCMSCSTPILSYDIQGNLIKRKNLYY